MIRQFYLALFLIAGLTANAGRVKQFSADHPYISYTGRVDYTNKQLPRFWQPGVYIEINFKGSTCDVILNDEMLWGKNHNYIQVVLDGKATRLRLNKATDTIYLGKGLSKGRHTLVISKNTEANIGWMELVAIRCEQLLPPPPRASRKIEFIGNSITCGASADMSQVPCGKGVWQDQHNAWGSYGAVTARSLGASYHLSSVSGIGLMHSCCNLDILMPKVFDKVSMRNDTIAWDFSRYQPDIVTVCLGQNDGIQDSSIFTARYIDFLGQLRKVYPAAQIICLTSPMADSKLVAFQRSVLSAIVTTCRKRGEEKLTWFTFTRQYTGGCDSHPSLADHQQIAAELTAFVRTTFRW